MTYGTKTSSILAVSETGSGAVRDKEWAHIRRIIEKVNTLFDGELTDQDKLVYVNDVLKGKLLESTTLAQQAASNTKEQFANSPDLQAEIMRAIIEALEAHTAMSTQAINSEEVRRGIKDIPLDHSRLWEELRERSG
jgi:type I restriction enzyme, R subunit